MGVPDQVSAEPVEYRQYRFAPPPGAASLLLIRHGESRPASEDNPAELTDGHSDPALDPVGVAQAERLADRLQHEHFDALYVTSLRRTAETIAPLAERLGMTPMVVKDLREVFLGEWEGYVFRKNTSEGHPIAVEMFTNQRWDVIPGAEPHADFESRVRSGITQIAEAHPNQRVAVVVHGGVIGMTMSIATGAGPFSFVGADNASISELVVHGDRWIVRRFNDTGHLEDM